MKIKWNGHASFTLTSEAGLKIITDPYEPSGFGGQIKYGPITDSADMVLVSHEHADHNYVQGLKGSPVVIKKTQEVKGIKFEVIPAFHDQSQGRERGENRIFLFELEGIKIAFLGDLGHILNPEQTKKLSDLDLLLIPVGGTFTVDAKQAGKIVEALKPKLVIPMHYKTAKIGFPIQSVDGFLSLFTKVKRLNSNETAIKKSDLPSSTEVWVLEPAC